MQLPTHDELVNTLQCMQFQPRTRGRRAEFETPHGSLTVIADSDSQGLWLLDPEGCWIADRPISAQLTAVLIETY